MNVIYMYGGVGGLGKTTYAKYLAEKQGKSVFICSSENDPFDGYMGQTCVIMDDARGLALSSVICLNFLTITRHPV